MKLIINFFKRLFGVTSKSSAQDRLLVTDDWNKLVANGQCGKCALPFTNSGHQHWGGGMCVACWARSH
ncbi:MAG: hypothetical protein AAB447_01155 [Patescibacteria group bacterium]